MLTKQVWFARVALAAALLFSFRARAQMATAGYSPEAIGFNPAAISSREFGIFGVLGDAISETDSYVGYGTNKLTGYRGQTVWSRDYKSFTIELYASYITGTEADSFAAGIDVDSSTNIQIYLGNLAYDLTKTIHVGAQYYVVKVDGADASSSGGNQTVQNIQGELDSFGGGLAWEIFKNFTIGGVYTRIGLSGSDGAAFVETGYGISYLMGTPKTSALRLEASYATMDPPSNFGSQMKQGVQETATIEGFHGKFAGGFTIQNTENMFLNVSSDIKTWLDTFTPTGNGGGNGVPQGVFSPTYSGYIGFRSQAGHSFSVRASYSKIDAGLVYYQGHQTQGSLMKQTVGFTYSFLF